MSGAAVLPDLSGASVTRSRPLRRDTAGNTSWQVAAALLLVVLMFRHELATMATSLSSPPPAVAPAPTAIIAPDTSPHAYVSAPPAAQPAALVPPSDSRPYAPIETAATPALPPPTLAPPAPALPVVITPSLDTSRNIAIARRNRNGWFEVDAAVNGTATTMLFDTGATLVVLSAADAARAGFDVNVLDFSHVAYTANGTAPVALVTIPTLTVGTITRRNVPALVSRPGRLEVSLLGQSFLSRVASYATEGDRLVIRGGEWRENR